jgi:23S rRNA (guanosine2251-2'-O)-methyltransferase
MRKLSMDELGRLSTEDFRTADKLPIVVILDNVRSGLNVGSVFRTCDAFKVERICICGYSSRPPHRDVLKTALGSTESVAWESYDSITDCIQGLKSQGYQIWAVEQVEDAVYLNEFEVQGRLPIAIIFGNEVMGVSEQALLLADGSIEVPQWGTKHSLNISVCAGVVLWELSSQWMASLP